MIFSKEKENWAEMAVVVGDPRSTSSELQVYRVVLSGVGSRV